MFESRSNVGNVLEDRNDFNNFITTFLVTFPSNASLHIVVHLVQGNRQGLDSHFRTTYFPSPPLHSEMVCLRQYSKKSSRNDCTFQKRVNSYTPQPHRHGLLEQPWTRKSLNLSSPSSASQKLIPLQQCSLPTVSKNEQPRPVSRNQAIHLQQI
jgi:hypothetical protein